MRYYCRECGSPELWQSATANANTLEVIDTYGNYYCPHCGHVCTGCICVSAGRLIDRSGACPGLWVVIGIFAGLPGWRP